MRKIFKNIFLVATDIAIVALAVIFTLYLKTESLSVIFVDKSPVLLTLYLFSISVVITNTLFECYSIMWNFAGIVEICKLSLSVLCSAIFNCIFLYVIKTYLPFFSLDVSLAFVLAVSLIEFVFMCFVRYSYRFAVMTYVSLTSYINRNKNRRVVFFGSADLCKIAIDMMLRKKNKRFLVAAVIDASQLDGSKISGVPAYTGTIDDVGEAIDNFKADELIVCMRDLSNADLLHLSDTCISKDCKLLQMADVSRVTKENVLPDLKNVHIEDLLGRKPNVLSKEVVDKYINNKVILVTGGAGSIGSEICRQVLYYNCAKLLVLDINENGLFYLQQELLSKYSEKKFELLIGSIRDIKRVESIFEKFHPDTVFHAAAHKHVPMMEMNPSEAIKNNVFGTLTVCRAAQKYEASKFILISTDKAVRPTNVMGCTKRIAELAILHMQNTSKKTDFAAVRFGNVLGSNGSVVLTFRKQIEAGGPVTVTHPNIERFFMTIPEAVSLVLTAGSLAKGGELFVLDMGSPVKVLKLAELMISLSGYKPYKDIDISFTGLRPGEKMYEELNFEDEITEKTGYEKINVLRLQEQNEDLEQQLLDLKQLAFSGNNSIDFRQVLKTIVPEFNPDTEPEDDAEEIDNARCEEILPVLG